jgi:Periplasmic protein involved in polysaccharide export
MNLKRYWAILLSITIGFSVTSYKVSAQSGSLSAIRNFTAASPKLDFGTTNSGVGESSAGPAVTSALNTPQGQAALAMVTPEYLVTPGDAYTLTFITANGPVISSVLVDSDYVINIANLGKVAAKGMRFLDLRKDVEKRVLAAYPLSAPQLIIQSCGSFPVYLQGEVLSSSTVYAWGLQRLSSLWSGTTPRASTRDIMILSADGTKKTYDLFKVWRNGDLSQDPYLKPKDTVVIGKYQRLVSISGEVHRPDSYQLLPGEGLAELLSVYAEGLLPTARDDYSSLARKASSEDTAGAAIFFDASEQSLKNEAGLPFLADGDTVFVPSRESYLPVIYFEGAVVTGTTVASVAANGSDKTTPMVAIKQYSTDRQVYKPGDKISRALRAEAQSISPDADLKGAFIIRKGQKASIPVNLEKILYAYDPSIDIELAAEDRIVIPYGLTDIFVTGEVAKSAWVNAGALMRLSAIVSPLLTKYSSLRNVLVSDSNGEPQSYDLFKAERYGDLSQDPFIRAGTTITVQVNKRSVTIDGEVQRPGTYQLLDGEKLSDLIEVYARGFTEQANPERLSLVRYVTSIQSSENLGEKKLINYSKEKDFDLMNFDAVTVHSSKELLPCVYFEGALGVGVNGEDPAVSHRQVYTFFPGELLSQAVQKIRAQFSAVADLDNAYIKRGDAKIATNISKILYQNDLSDDRTLVENDTIIIPFRQFFVSVAGAVMTPGRYPYVPDRSWDYYVNLAGGFNTEKNSGDIVNITDVNGKHKDKGAPILPEDSIVAASNSFIYSFGRISTILSMIISAATLAITIYKLFP